MVASQWIKYWYGKNEYQSTIKPIYLFTYSLNYLITYYL